MTTENFAELFQESIANLDFLPGAVITGKILEITHEFVIVDAGLKTESYISIREFKNREGDIEVAAGDEADVVVESVEDGSGETRLSREKAKRLEAWKTLEIAHEASASVPGIITERVRGGFTVELEGLVKAFLPGSQVDVRPVRDPSYLIGKDIDFKIIKIDKKRNNIVVSRRAALAEEAGGSKESLLASLQEGQEIIGVVKNLTDYGVFVDLGGLDGLLHITDMSWKRVKHPSELLNIGDEIKVKVLKIDQDHDRVSLGLKQLGDDPWKDIGRRYPTGTRLFGKVTNLTDYGCFVEIEEGIEGLVHMSEMDWTNKNIHPAKIIAVGDEVEVMILEVDEDRRRISLGMKQCQSNPWAEFAQTHNKGDMIKGPIKSITDFGVFVGLEGGIDGLVHLSDISWTDTGERVVRGYKKGQEMETVILAIDSERERISLGIKQLENDVYANYFATHPKGSAVTGAVISVDPKGVTVDLGDDIVGKLKSADISVTRIKDATDVFELGDIVEAKISGFDKKARHITLSRKDLEKEQNDADVPVNTQLSEQLKEHMDK